jgi:hypothetical protein
MQAARSVIAKIAVRTVLWDAGVAGHLLGLRGDGESSFGTCSRCMLLKICAGPDLSLATLTATQASHGRGWSVQGIIGRSFSAA